jgi:hypothetical protein
MDVFLIPLGPDERYELYCEPADGPAASADEAPRRGPLRRMWARFQEMLAAAEEAQRQPDAPHPATWSDRLMRWVAERIAEQRLLWHLRRQEQAALHYPADLDAAGAARILRGQLAADAERHRRWMVIDTVLTVITGPLFFFVPGPNVIAYFFLFRAVGHYLSHRGARKGLDAVAWQYVVSEPLRELRRAIVLDEPVRSERVGQVASQLQLEHLPGFVQRVALRSA